MSRWLTIMIVAASLLFQVDTADADNNTALASKMIIAGDKALAQGDRLLKARKGRKAQAAYRRGLAHYTKAYETVERPEIYYAIARAERKLGRHLLAMRHLETLLASAEGVDSKLIDLVKVAITEVGEKLAALEVVVDQDGAKVSIDGEELGSTPLPGAHYLAAGKHKLVISLEGYEAIEETLDLAVGKTLARDFTLAALPEPDEKVEVVEPKVKAIVENDLALTSVADTGPLALNFGAAGFFLVAAGAAAWRAKISKDKEADMSLSQEIRDASADTKDAFNLATGALVAASLVFLASGTHYYFTTYSDATESERKPGIVLAPQVTEQGASISFEASF